MDPRHAIRHPHDALFRAVFADPARAGVLLRSALPADAAVSVDWASLARVDGTFVDAALRSQQADLLFTATAHGRPTLIYFLLEHKAGDDPWTALQLLRYVVRIWERWRRENPTERRLPPVFVFVLHHGDRPWQGPRDLRGLLDLDGLPAAFTAMQPSFSFAIDDLAASDEPTLRRRKLAVHALLPLLHLQSLRRHADTAALLRRWTDLHRSLLSLPGGQEIAHQLVSYVAAVSNDDPDRLAAAYRAIDPTMEIQFMTTASKHLQTAMQQGMQQGLQQGMQQGRAEGAHEATVDLLVLLLDQRFGALPESAVRRLSGCSAAELDRIARTVLTAASLDDVFAAG